MTELFPTAWSVISSTLAFFIGLGVVLKVGPHFGVGQRRSVLLYIWHTSFCILYLFYVKDSGGDAIMYYETSRQHAIDLTFGTAAILFITRVFSNYLGMSILGVFLVFNVAGTIGLLAFDGALKIASAGKGKVIRVTASLLVFLPSASFWSAAIGKDAISFAAMGLALWSAINVKRSFWLMVAAIAIMASVRPHMAVLLSVAYAVSFALDARSSLFSRCLTGVAAAGASLVLIPLALGISGLGSEGGITAVSEYVEVRQGYNTEGGGGVDISSMSLPAKMFTYLFRPLPFEAHSVPALAASLDNVVLLGLLIFGLFSLIARRGNLKEFNWVFLLTYSLASWLLLSLTTANLGISMRQKWMFVPIIIVLLVALLGAPLSKPRRSPL